MRHLALVSAVSLLLTLSACQQASPTQPADADHAGVPPIEAALEIPDDEGLREATALLSGDLDVNGTGTTLPGGVASPGTVTQPASTGELALIRVRATMTDASTPTLHTNLRGATGTAYAGMNIAADDRNYYRAMYITGTESLSLRMYNAATYNGPINAAAAQYNYLFETRPIEDSSEPNDDENPATLSDRSLAKAAHPGANLTRSVYEYNTSIKDREEWFRSTLPAGPSYDYKMTTYQPRYGTWSYVLNFYDASGGLLRTQSIPAGAESGTLETGEILTSGDYYLQIVATPVTKSGSSNLYYTPYTLTVCEDPTLISPIEFLTFQPAPGEMCPGTGGRWEAAVSLEDATFSWNFGGGCTPNTSTALSPTVTLGSKGRYSATLTARTPCGGVEVFHFTYDVLCAWQSQFAKAGTATGSVVTPEEIAVQPNGDVFIVATFLGSNVGCNVNHEGLSSPTVSSGSGGTALNALLVQMDKRGEVLSARNIASGNGPVRARGLAVDPNGNAYVTGFFYGTVDFDPSANTVSRTSAGNSDAFLAVYPASGAAPIVGTWGASGFDSAESVVVTSANKPIVCGYYQWEPDFDPGPNSAPWSANGAYDFFVARYSASAPGTPLLEEMLARGSEGNDRAYDLVYNNLFEESLYVAGAFTNTVNFYYPNGVRELTSSGGEDAFLLELEPNDILKTTPTFWITRLSGAGTERGFAVTVDDLGQPYFGGTFASTATVRYSAGGTGMSLTSSGSSDAFVVALSTSGIARWAVRGGGTSADTLTDLAWSTPARRLYASGNYQGYATWGASNNAWSTSRTATGSTDGYLLGLRVETAPDIGTLGSLSIPVSTGGDSFTALGTPLSTINDQLILGGTFTTSIAAPNASSKLWGFNLTPQGSTDGFALSLTANGDFHL